MPLLPRPPPVCWKPHSFHPFSLLFPICSVYSLFTFMCHLHVICHFDAIYVQWMQKKKDLDFNDNWVLLAWSRNKKGECCCCCFFPPWVQRTNVTKWNSLMKMMWPQKLAASLIMCYHSIMIIVGLRPFSFHAHPHAKSPAWLQGKLDRNVITQQCS